MFWPLSSSRIRRTFRTIGMRLTGGCERLCAYMITRERGTQTPATGTTAAFSCYLAPGQVLVDAGGRIWHLPANSYTARDLSGIVTPEHLETVRARGLSGAPPARAG